MNTSMQSTIPMISEKPKSQEQQTSEVWPYKLSEPALYTSAHDIFTTVKFLLV